MRAVAILALAAALASLTAPHTARAQADAYGAGMADTLQPDSLDPYGTWVQDDIYGQAWEPAVAGDWRPYVNGYWGWGDAGWTWVSYDPWGFTFHYGRWAFSPVYGWVWVPDTAWGPAWVDWLWGDGFVGWAPLPPVGIVVVSQFVFVNEAQFCHPHLSTVVVDAHRVPPGVVRDGTRHRPPDQGRITQVSAHPVPHPRRPAGTVPFVPPARTSPVGERPVTVTRLGAPRPMAGGAPVPGVGTLAVPRSVAPPRPSDGVVLRRAPGARTPWGNASGATVVPAGPARAPSSGAWPRREPPRDLRRALAPAPQARPVHVERPGAVAGGRRPTSIQ